jgi:hypothetical protein
VECTEGACLKRKYTLRRMGDMKISQNMKEVRRAVGEFLE